MAQFSERRLRARVLLLALVDCNVDLADSDGDLVALVHRIAIVRSLGHGIDLVCARVMAMLVRAMIAHRLKVVILEQRSDMELALVVQN